MKLKDLIKSNNWLSVELTLLQLYPDQKGIIDEYRNVFEKLKFLESEEYEDEIQKQFDAIKKEIEEYKNLTEEEKKKKPHHSMN